MEKVEFPTNIPQILQLQFSEGKPVTSQFAGEQIMFTLVDGRRMYLSPWVADKIREAGIQARTPFQICKREIAKGKIQFEVSSLANPTSGGTALEIADKIADKIREARTPFSFSKSLANPTSLSGGAALTAPSATTTTQPDFNAPGVIGERLYAPTPRVDVPTSATPDGPISPASTKLMGCLMGAIDAAVEAEAYAQRKGLELRFSSEDIRTMANTLAMNGGVR